MIRCHYSGGGFVARSTLPEWARSDRVEVGGRAGRQCAVYSTESVAELKDWCSRNRVLHSWITLTSGHHLPHVLLFGSGLNKALTVSEGVDAETFEADQQAWAARKRAAVAAERTS